MNRGGEAPQPHPATGEHQLAETLAVLLQGPTNQPGHLPGPGLDDLGQPAPGHLLRPHVGAPHQGHHLLGQDLGGVAVAVAALEQLGLVLVAAKPSGQVVGDVLAPHREHHHPADGPGPEDGDVGGAGADIHDRHPALQLHVPEHPLGRGQRLDHHVVDAKPGGMGTAHQGGQVGAGRHHQLGLHRQAATGDPARVPDPGPGIDPVLAGDQVDHLLALEPRHGPAGLEHPAEVTRAHRPTPRGHRDHRLAGAALDVAAAQREQRRVNLRPAGPLGRVQALGDRLGGGIRVGDDPLVDPAGGALPHPQHPQPIAVILGHGTAGLGTAQVDGGQTAAAQLRPGQNRSPALAGPPRAGSVMSRFPNRDGEIFCNVWMC